TTTAAVVYAIAHFTRVPLFFLFFFFKDTATTEIYTLSLHDALPILGRWAVREGGARGHEGGAARDRGRPARRPQGRAGRPRSRRSEEHTSELQSRGHLVCRLLLEKKKKDEIAYNSCESRHLQDICIV